MWFGSVFGMIAIFSFFSAKRKQKSHSILEYSNKLKFIEHIINKNKQISKKVAGEFMNLLQHENAKWKFIDRI